jgi:TRAP-type uncharacterized transport system substrate-binding protein
MKKISFKYHGFMLGMAIFLVMLYAALSAIPSNHIRIAAGPIGGSFYGIAQQYEKILREKGYQVEIVPFSNTDEIAANLANRKKKFDAGFVANGLEGKNAESLISLGEIQLQPIFIFVNKTRAAARHISSVADLRGMSLVLPPERSVTSQTLVNVFSLYGINRSNTNINFVDLGEGITQLKQGKFDAGLFILAADNDSVLDLANHPDINLVQLGQQAAIVKKLPYLKKVNLPAGIFNLQKEVPPQKTELLAASISLAARKDLPSATLYALLEAMREVHGKSSYVNDANDFPKYSGSSLHDEDRIKEFYKNGTPWIFSNFPMVVSSIVDAYLAPLLGVWFFLSIFGVVVQLEKIRYLSLVVAAYMSVIWMRWRAKQGWPPSQHNRVLLEKLRAAIVAKGSGISSLLREMELIEQEW